MHRVWTIPMLSVALVLAALGGLVGPGQAQPVEIEFWYGLGGFLGQTVERIIQEFNESQNEVKVIGIAQADYDETMQKLQAAIAAGVAPAAVLMNQNEAVALARRGIFTPLDEYIAADPTVDLDDYIEAFTNVTNLDGRQYSLPLYGTTQVLYYRHDMFKDAGIDADSALDTWEGLAEAAAKLTRWDGNNVVVYGWEPMWGEGNMVDSAQSRGLRILSEDGTKVQIDSPGWIETWESFRRWLHDEKIMRIHHGGIGWEYWYRTIADVLEGRAAGYTGSSGDQGDLDFTIVSAHPQPAWQGHTPAPSATAKHGMIPEQVPEEKKRAAFKWLAFFTSPEKTADWSMSTGYIGVRKSARVVPTFQAYVEANPHALVPLLQAETAIPEFLDPTGSDIWNALSDAADQVQIENIPARQALQRAARIAQRALDRVLR